jgi:TolA-binding protein
MKYFYTLLLTICLTSGTFASAKLTLDEQLAILKAAKSKIESTQSSLNKANSSIASQRTAISKLKGDIQTERNEKNAIQQRLNASEEKYEKLRIKQLQTGRERDLFIVAFAILATFSLYGIIKPFIGLVPPPYSYAVYIASPIAIFFGVFFGIRLLIQLIVKFVF